jgi:regulator of ribosome biosynthesis
LTYDLKNLAAFDIAPIASGTDILAYTRDSVQLLVNKVFALPRNVIDEGTVVTLPSEEVFRLPRAKPIPKEKPKTRWEKFMEERNMKKRKRSKLVWDDVEEDWKPRWGYKSAKNSAERTKWFHEVGPNENPTDNPFEQKKAEGKLLKARQKMREVRNKVEAAGGKLRASVPDLQGGKRGKDGLREAMKRAQVSSASFGKFDRIAPNETTNLQPKQKKGVAPVSSSAEKDRYLKAATRVLSGDGPVNKHKAAKLGVSQDMNEKDRARVSKAPKGGKRRSKQGGKRHGKR